MNRLYHLKGTLKQNIEDNLTYSNLEHVLLDYNSEDDMGAWIKEHLSEYIKANRLRYYRTPDPAKFNMAHSKNMAAKLAEGDIICMVDADNYTGRNYAHYVNNYFCKHQNCFLTTIAKRKIKYGPDVLGRACFWKNDFFSIQGFDEFMSGYGFDDHDFANRLSQLGRERRLITGKKFLKAISHTNNERLTNQKSKGDFHSLFIHHIDPVASELLFLFKDRTFNIGVMIDNRVAAAADLRNLLKEKKYKYNESLATENWIEGIWNDDDKNVFLHLKDGMPVVLNIISPVDLVSQDGKSYFKVDDENLHTDLLFFHTLIRNRNKMIANDKQRRLIVNHNGFGSGTVFKNFDNNLPIPI